MDTPLTILSTDDLLTGDYVFGPNVPRPDGWSLESLTSCVGFVEDQADPVRFVTLVDSCKRTPLQAIVAWADASGSVLGTVTYRLPNGGGTPARLIRRRAVKGTVISESPIPSSTGGTLMGKIDMVVSPSGAHGFKNPNQVHAFVTFVRADRRDPPMSIVLPPLRGGIYDLDPLVIIGADEEPD